MICFSDDDVARVRDPGRGWIPGHNAIAYVTQLQPTYLHAAVS